MQDSITINLLKAIRKEAERKLGRPLNSVEADRLNKPRSYVALESILDYVKGEDDAKKLDSYLSKI